jgi:hypothetical protein
MRLKSPIDPVARWFHADETATDDIGWTANLAVFRIAFLALAALPFGFRLLSWTIVMMPSIPAGGWVPISFYRYVPLAILSNAKLAEVLIIADLVLLVL